MSPWLAAVSGLEGVLRIGAFEVARCVGRSVTLRHHVGAEAVRLASAQAFGGALGGQILASR